MSRAACNHWDRDVVVVVASCGGCKHFPFGIEYSFCGWMRYCSDDLGSPSQEGVSSIVLPGYQHGVQWKMLAFHLNVTAPNGLGVFSGNNQQPAELFCDVLSQLEIGTLSKAVSAMKACGECHGWECFPLGYAFGLFEGIPSGFLFRCSFQCR